MNWTEYQKHALETAIYPKTYGVVYTTLGLVDEIYEFYESIGSDEEVSELSDCCWYAACFSYECGIDLQDTEELAFELEDQFSFHDVFDAVYQMQGAASRVCGIVKKYMRDDNSNMNSSHRAKIQVELSLIILSIYYICNQMKITFDDVATYNINKLASRKQRGKLGGSGGKR